MARLTSQNLSEKMETGTIFLADYHIGATYLKDEIINNIAKKMKQDPWLHNLLDSQSISVNSQVTFDNLEPIFCVPWKSR